MFAAAWISSGVAPPEAVGAGMFIKIRVVSDDDDDLLPETNDDFATGGVNAWLLDGSDSATASAVIDSFMVVNRDLLTVQ